MHMNDVIDEFRDFDALRPNWDAVYEADLEAHFFLSWQWLSDWLTAFRTIWFVLAAKRNETDRAYSAFLLLRMRTDFDKKHGFYNEIYFGGAGFSDYTGILARPEVEAEAVPALAEYLKRKVNWAKFTMDNLTMSEQRRRLLMRAFDKIRFTHTPIEYKNGDDPTNHAICPSINLPGSWDNYLKTLSTNNRRKNSTPFKENRRIGRVPDYAVRRQQLRSRSLGSIGFLEDQVDSQQGGKGRRHRPAQLRDAQSLRPERDFVPARILAWQPAGRGARDPD